MELYRLFIAVEIENREVYNNILRIRDVFKGINANLKFVEDENIHLTIRFIGEVPQSLIPEIINAMKPASNIESFDMKVEGLGAFPSDVRPRVIWIGVSEGVEKLRSLRNTIEVGLRRLGIRPERQEFSPHITLARVKSSRNIDKVSKLILEFKNYVAGVTRVTKVKLKRSILRPQGPLYIDIHEVKLK